MSLVRQLLSDLDLHFLLSAEGIVDMDALSVLEPSSTVDTHFYCDFTINQSSPSCLSLSQFGSSPLDQLCPTKNYLEACQDLEPLYEVVASGVQVPWIMYGRCT